MVSYKGNIVMLRFLAVTALLIPSFCFGQTITLPKTITADRKIVIVKPEFDKVPKAVAFEVLGVKKPPEAVIAGNFLILAQPDPDEEITIVVAAVFETNILKTAITTVIPPAPGGTGTGTGTGGTATPPTVDKDIPATATGLNVIMVVELNKEPADIKALAVGSNAVTQALGSRQGKWWVRNSTDSFMTHFQNDIRGKALPVLLVLGPGNKVLHAETFVPTGTVEATARRILTTIANAIK